MFNKHKKREVHQRGRNYGPPLEGRPVNQHRKQLVISAFYCIQYHGNRLIYVRKCLLKCDDP